MPKSKVRKKAYSPSSSSAPATSGGTARTSRTLAPSPVWYPILMAAFLVIGLAWIVAYYIAGEHIPVIKDLGGWNFLVGFGFMIVGLGLAIRWR